MNIRRKLLIALGTSLSGIPVASFAQQPGKVWRIGFLVTASRPTSLEIDPYGGFLRGMRELGYLEGRNLAIEWRFADTNQERLQKFAAELVQMELDVLVANGTDAPRAAQKASNTLPIVMTSASDPVGAGLIRSLARPAGNVTGVSTITTELGPKRLELLLGMVPRLSRVAVMVNPTAGPNIKALESIQSAAQKRRVTILRADARTPAEMDNAFSMMGREKAGALIVVLSPLFQRQRSQIAELSARHRLPSMTPDRIYTEAGCLMSYGSSLTEGFHRAATYVDRILKGAKPGDLPVEEPTRFELVINRKTAKALGITLTQTFLLQADEVIE